MNNRVDFFQPQVNDLAIPAGTAVVSVEGHVRGDLRPVEIVRAGWPGFGRARLAYHPAAGGSAALAVEDIERICPMGAAVRIDMVYKGLAADGPKPYPLFVGRVEETQMRLGNRDETVEVIARDFGAELECTIVFGRRVTSGQATEFAEGLPTTFNPGQLGNASPSLVRHNGRAYRVFATEGTAGRPWRCGEVVEYLLNEHLPAGCLGRPSLTRLLALTGNAVMPDLDLTGRNLAEALWQCCRAAGIRFRFDTRDSESGPREAIVFYRPGRGREVELNRQPSGQRLSLSKTNIAELHGRRQRPAGGLRMSPGPSPAHGSAVIERFDVRTLTLETDYQPGDRAVTGPDSRDVFGLRRGRRSVCWIESVRMDFERQQTHLQVVRAEMGP